MPNVLTTPQAQAVLLFAILLMLVAAGMFILRRFRDGAEQGRLEANQMLTNFGELHERGDVSDAEFRTINTVLREKLQRELNDTGDQG